MTDRWKFQSPLATLQQRAFLLAEIRRFFADRKVLEVNTPILASFGNTDLHIDGFKTDAINRENQAAFLRTSPEFFHKRLLASGAGDLFELASVFRRDESTPLHNPEFTLLEWYRLDFDLTELMAEVVAFIQSMVSAFNLPALTITHISYQNLLLQFAEIDPFEITVEALNEACLAHGYSGPVLDRAAALDFIFAVVVEPVLHQTKAQGWMVYHFPVEMAALAQVNPDHPDRCLRFECLWNGIELANGYQELTDVVEQQARFNQDNAMRLQMGKAAVPMDEHLLAAIGHGLPACSGVAIGVERLLMCLLGQTNIKTVMGFPADHC